MNFIKNFLIKKVFYELKTIDNVKSKKSDFELKPQRDKINICVIDDEGFPLSDSLRKLGYSNIDIKYNFVDINEYEKYDIIFCDLDGVGKIIDSKKQGLAIVEQIRIVYPSKKIFIYSGKTLEGYGEVPKDVLYISKHSNSNEISQILDTNCSYLWDPIEAWEIILKKLYDCNINAKIIAIIEDRYVESILSKDNLFIKRKIKIEDLKRIDDIMSFVNKIISIITGVS